MPSAEGRFPRRCRLLKPTDFRQVFDDNVSSGDQYFLLLGRSNGLDYARLGLAISKKKTRRAVDRNRLKRVIRESFRLHQVMLTGLDLVVVNRRADMSDSNGHYLNSLSLHWHRMARKCKRS